MRTVLVIIALTALGVFAACAALLPREDLPMVAFAFVVVMTLGGAPVVFGAASRRVSAHGSLRRPRTLDAADDVEIVRTTGPRASSEGRSPAPGPSRTGVRPPDAPSG